MPIFRSRASSISAASADYAPTGSSGKLHCTICQREFNRNRKADLDRHMRVHTGEKPYKCTFAGCNSSFSQSQAAKNHMNKHTGKKPYRCDQCSSTFYDKPTANRHKREKHGPEIIYQCKGCDRGFKRKSVYKQHVQSEHGKIITDEEASRHRTNGSSTDVESPTTVSGSPIAMNPLYPAYSQPSVHASQYVPSGYAMTSSSGMQDGSWMFGYPDAMSGYPASTSTIPVQAGYSNWYDNSQYSQPTNVFYGLDSGYPAPTSQRQSPRSVHHTPTSSQSSISSSHNRSPVPAYHSPTGSPVQVQVGMPANELTTYANSYYRTPTQYAYNHPYYQ